MSRPDQGVLFDLAGTGAAVLVSWTLPGTDDAWLALDRNGNGQIDDGTELFGNHSPQPIAAGMNGFLALAEYDKPERGGNEDGWISSADAVWPMLRLWRDANHSGHSEPDELLTLESVAIEGISLHYHEQKWTDAYGNEYRYRSRLRTSPRSRVGRWAIDVYLRAVGQP